MPGNWPEFPGLEDEQACKNYVEEVRTYVPTSPQDKCNLIQDACDNLECGSNPPFPDLCVELRQIAAGAGCSVNCGVSGAC